MRIQRLYELRDEFQFASGLDLQLWLEKTSGTTSGNHEIATDVAISWVVKKMNEQFVPGGVATGEKWREDVLSVVRSWDGSPAKGKNM